MRKVHQSYYCLSYFRPPTSVEEVSMSQPSSIVPPSPGATQQNYLEVFNRAFHEKWASEPETNLKQHTFRWPAGHKRHAVATCMLLMASLCFLIMADSIYVYYV